MSARVRDTGTFLSVTVLTMSVLCTAANYIESLSRDGWPGLGYWEPQVAMFCGKLNMVMDIDLGEWRPDPSGTYSCLGTREEILTYCLKVYPELPITGVMEAAQPVRIENWCRKGKRKCTGHVHIVVPYHCQVKGLVSEVLLVPDRCKFLHQETMDTCETHIHWHGVAKEACTAETLEVHSYGMLLPCGQDRFRGVEYVCCPSRFHGARFEDVMVPTLMGDSIEGEPGDRSQEEDASPVTDLDEEDQSLEYGMANSHWTDSQDTSSLEAEAYHEAVTETSTTTTTTTTTEGSIENTQGLPFPEPTFYPDYFDNRAFNEHKSYTEDLTELDTRRNERINEVMKEWAAADRRSLLVQKPDRISLNKHFQEVLVTVEGQFVQERQRLMEHHISRVTAFINEERQWALEQYLKELQAERPEPSRVYRTVLRYLRAEGKDLKHTVGHYRRVLQADPEKARQMKFQVLTHLQVIDQRMNQTVSLMFRYPDLARVLGASVLEAMQGQSLRFREKVTQSDPMGVPPSEGHNQDGVLRPTQPTSTAQGLPECTEGAKEETESTLRQGSGLVDYYDTVVTEAYAGERFVTEYEDTIEDSVEVIYNSKETSEIQRDEMEPESKVAFNKGILIGLLVIAVAIAMIVVLSLFMVRRKPYGSISHGIVEVDPMLSPEERQLSAMQNHGYENPSYKFFEQLQN